MSDTFTAGPEKRGPGRPSNAEIARRNAERSPEHIASASPDHRESEHDTAHTKPRVRTRSRQRASDVSNPFHIPVGEIPEGSSYEWKRFSNVGQEDPFYLAQMRRQGWEPVDPRRHPNWIPEGYTAPHIIREGMILMERPIELTLEAIAEREMLAKQQIREAESRLGMAPRINGIDTGTRQLPGVQPKLVKEWGRMSSIPIEE